MVHVVHESHPEIVKRLKRAEGHLRKVIAMLPDRDCELGVVADDEIVITGLRPDGTWGAAKVRQDDPRMALGGATIPLL